MSASATGAGAPRRRLFWIASVLSVAAVAVVVALLAGTFTGGGSQGTQAVFEVAQGPLTISVSESGTVQPKDQIILKSEVEGTTTILFLVEEGTKVKKGDLLVELDASKLQDSKVEQEIIGSHRQYIEDAITRHSDQVSRECRFIFRTC